MKPGLRRLGWLLTLAGLAAVAVTGVMLWAGAGRAGAVLPWLIAGGAALAAGVAALGLSQGNVTTADDHARDGGIQGAGGIAHNSASGDTTSGTGMASVSDPGSDPGSDSGGDSGGGDGGGK